MYLMPLLSSSFERRATNISNLKQETDHLISAHVVLFISTLNFCFVHFLLNGMIPEPDYESQELEGKRNSKICPNGGVRFNEDGLVIPKKPQNPCLESSERQNLHRELMFNQKMGKSVIGQKTELQKTFDKLREDQKKKELDEERLQKKSALEKKLEEQANKLKQQEELENKKLVEIADQPEFLRVHARVCAQTVDSKS